jgi:hypothetical protein
MGVGIKLCICSQGAQIVLFHSTYAFWRKQYITGLWISLLLRCAAQACPRHCDCQWISAHTFDSMLSRAWFDTNMWLLLSEHPLLCSESLLDATRLQLCSCRGMYSLSSPCGKNCREPHNLSTSILLAATTGSARGRAGASGSNRRKLTRCKSDIDLLEEHVP